MRSVARRALTTLFPSAAIIDDRILSTTRLNPPDWLQWSPFNGLQHLAQVDSYTHGLHLDYGVIWRPLAEAVKIHFILAKDRSLITEEWLNASLLQPPLFATEWGCIGDRAVLMVIEWLIERHDVFTDNVALLDTSSNNLGICLTCTK